MLYAILKALNVAKHHGCRGPESKSVCCLHDIKPLAGSCLSWCNLLPHPVNEDLCPSTWNGVKAGINQPFKHLPYVKAGYVTEMDNLRGGKSVTMYVKALYKADHLFIEGKGQIRVKPSLQEYLCTAKGLCLLYLFPKLLKGKHKALWFFRGAVVGTELTA